MGHSEPAIVSKRRQARRSIHDICALKRYLSDDVVQAHLSSGIPGDDGVLNGRCREGWPNINPTALPDRVLARVGDCSGESRSALATVD